MVPLDLWGGWDGNGFDGALFLSTGTRVGGAASRVYRHDDRRGDRHWAEEIESGTETMNKIRDGVDPETGQPRLWAYNEGPHPGQSWLAYRSKGSATWGWEDIPHSGNAVGGRGLGVDGNQVYAGGSHNWGTTKDGKLYVKNGGSWVPFRTPPGKTLLWEVEFEGPGGARWEFWNHFAGTDGPLTYRNGSQLADPPGGDISQAAWFPKTGHMYVVGDLSDKNGRTVYRWSGGWESVVTVSLSTTLDHVVYVPRGSGELWVVGMNPLQVLSTLDGSLWSEHGLPRVETGDDTNHVTALGYYGGRVWVAARESGRTRIFRESKPSTIAAGRGLQII